MSKHTDSFETLDPQDWEQSKALMHQMVDDAFDYTKNVRERKIWQEMPGLRGSCANSLTLTPTDQLMSHEPRTGHERLLVYRVIR